MSDEQVIVGKYNINRTKDLGNIHKVTMVTDNKVIKFRVNNSRIVKFACRPLLHFDIRLLLKLIFL